MKKLDKAKINKLITVFDTIVSITCCVMGIITQLIEQDTTQALCWVIAGTLVGATKVEVKYV